MITIKYKDMRSEGFKTAMAKLCACGQLDPKTRYAISRVAKFTEQKIADSQKEWQDLLKKYVVVEDGKFKIKEDNSFFELLEGADRDVVLREMEAFGEKSASLSWDAFNIDLLDNAYLSPIDLSYLEPILIVPEDCVVKLENEQTAP